MSNSRGSQSFRWLTDAVIHILIVGAGVGATIALESALEAPSIAGSTAFVWFVVCTLIGLIIAVAQIRGAHRARAQDRQRVSSFNDTLSDSIRALSDLVNSGGSPKERANFFKVVVNEAKSLIPLESARTCVYELDAGETEQGDTKTHLRRASWAGRADEPRQEFSQGSPHGARLIKVAESGKIWCVSHPDRFGPQVDRHEDAEWHSFLAVPLHVNGRPHGVLTIDTTKTTVFDDAHKTIAWTIARLLQIGFANVAEAAEETLPETRMFDQRIRLDLSRTSGDRSPHMSVTQDTVDQHERIGVEDGKHR